MELSAVALLVVLVGLMSIGLPITWALGGACISAILLDPNLSLAMITQKYSQDVIILPCWHYRPSF